MIYMGADFFGVWVAASKGGRLIEALVEAAIKLRGSFKEGSGPGIIVLFSVPGSLGSCGWEGIRATKFSRKTQELVIEVGVPAELVHSPEFPDYLKRTLHEANAIAFDTFRKKGIQFPLSDAELLVQRIIERVGIAGAADRPEMHSLSSVRLPSSDAELPDQRLVQHMGRAADAAASPDADSRSLEPLRSRAPFRGQRHARISSPSTTMSTMLSTSAARRTAASFF